jgi:hypothetical protein
MFCLVNYLGTTLLTGVFGTGFFLVQMIRSFMDLEPSILSRSSPLMVRLALPNEQDRWRAFMREHHYLGFKRIIGKALHYVAAFEEQWVALIGWGSAALKCSARDRFIWLGQILTV